MLLALLSLAGVPPLAGLIGKFLVFYALVRAAAEHPTLVVAAFLGAVGVVLSLYYYLLFIREMYVKAPPERAGAMPAAPWTARLVLVGGVVSLVLLGVYWRPLQEAASHAAQALFAAR